MSSRVSGSISVRSDFDTFANMAPLHKESESYTPKRRGKMRYRWAHRFRQAIWQKNAIDDFAAFMITTHLNGRQESTWIIDSGATAHFTYWARSKFETFSVTDTAQTITTASGDKLRITGVGSVRCENGILLKHVLQVPEIKANLLSVSKVTMTARTRVIFSTDVCRFETTEGILIASGHRNKSLFTFDLRPSTDKTSEMSAAVASHSSAPISTQRWHEQLGHPGGVALGQTIKHTLGAQMDQGTLQTCHPCIQGKGTKRPPRVK